MIRLSQDLIRKFSVYAAYVGDDLGYAPDNTIPSNAVPLWCDLAILDFANDGTPDGIPYAFFVSKSDFMSKKYDDFYFFIHSTVYKCKSSLHNTFSYDELVILFYLLFEKHFNFKF